jgi:hypothetical protein
LGTHSGGLNDGIERLRIVDGNFTEHLTVQGDIGLFTAINKLAVPYPALPACGAQSNDPQAPEIAFSAFAIDSGVDVRAESGFFGKTILAACCAAIALDRFEDSFFRLAPCSAFSYSWHVSFPLKLGHSSRLLAAAEWVPTQAEKQACSMDHELFPQRI